MYIAKKPLTSKADGLDMAQLMQCFQTDYSWWQEQPVKDSRGHDQWQCQFYRNTNTCIQQLQVACIARSTETVFWPCLNTFQNQNLELRHLEGFRNSITE